MLCYNLKVLHWQMWAVGLPQIFIVSPCHEKKRAPFHKYNTFRQLQTDGFYRNNKNDLFKSEINIMEEKQNCSGLPIKIFYYDFHFELLCVGLIQKDWVNYCICRIGCHFLFYPQLFPYHIEPITKWTWMSIFKLLW